MLKFAFYILTVTFSLEWDIEKWFPLPFPNIPLRLKAYNVGTGEVLEPSAQTDGWINSYVPGVARPSPDASANHPQVCGYEDEVDSLISRSARGFNELLMEALLTEPHCRGSIPEHSLMGHRLDRTIGNHQRRGECIRECESLIGRHLPAAAMHHAKISRSIASANRSRIAESAFMSDCRVPLTHSWRGRLMRVLVNGGPTATIHLPNYLWRHAQMQSRLELTEFLILVNVSHCPPRINLRDKPDPWRRSLRAKENPSSTNVEDEDVGSDSAESDSARWFHYKRPISRPLGFFDFQPGVQLEPPRFMVTLAQHYSTYELSAMGGRAEVFGRWSSTELEVVSMPYRNVYMIDISELLRRLWDTDQTEIGLISNCNIAGIQDRFAFRKALSWIYQPESWTCPLKRTCKECRAEGCTWCRRVPKTEDFFDLEWANASGISPQGLCGTPKATCMALFGAVGNPGQC